MMAVNAREQFARLDVGLWSEHVSWCLSRLRLPCPHRGPDLWLATHRRVWLFLREKYLDTSRVNARASVYHTPCKSRWLKHGKSNWRAAAVNKQSTLSVRRDKELN
jgi:hypothetical protein